MINVRAAWDECSKTPFLYNTAQKTIVSYDGARLLFSGNISFIRI